MIALPLLTAGCSTTTSEDKEDAANNAKNAVETNVLETQNQVEVAALEKKRQLQIEAEKAEKAKQDALLKTSTIFFNFDATNIEGKYFEVLEAHAAYLTKNPNVKIRIEGHADERGTPEYNIALGERRAKSVVQYLQNRGVSTSQISTVSYGEEKPINTSRTEAGFAQNRRAVLVY